MKKLPILPILLFTIAVAIGISCKKDDDKKTAACTTDVASISGPYKITAYTYKQTPTSPEEDMLATFFDDCERDDVFSFNSNGNYAVADVGVVCSPSGGYSGTWSLSGNSMNVDGDIYTIESFNCKTLVLVSNDAIVTGDKIKLTLTRQ